MLVISADQYTAHIESGAEINSGSINAPTVKFRLDEFWNDYVVTALFEGSGSVKHIADIKSETEYNVPWECITLPGDLKVTVFGIKDGKRVTTRYVSAHIVDSGVSEPTSPQATADAYTQFISETVAYRDEAKEAAQQAKADAEYINSKAGEPTYRWVLLDSGTVNNKTEAIIADKYNGKAVKLYGAAVKYDAPTRHDNNSYAAYLQLGEALYTESGTFYWFSTKIEVGINSATVNYNTGSYGAAMLDCSCGLTRGWYYTNAGTPSNLIDFSFTHPMPFQKMLTAPDTSNLNAVKFYSPRQTNDAGMFEKGTNYQLWGLVKGCEL